MPGLTRPSFFVPNDSSVNGRYREQQAPGINQACLREHRQAVEMSKLLADAVITVSKKRPGVNGSRLRENPQAGEASPGFSGFGHYYY